MIFFLSLHMLIMIKKHLLVLQESHCCFSQITPSQVMHLTDTEFQELGVLTIGDRIRLKEKCREIMSGILERFHKP